MLAHYLTTPTEARDAEKTGNGCQNSLGDVGYGGYGPLETLLKDDSISEITCIGPRRTYIERNGLLEEVPCYFENEGQMLRIIEQMVLVPVSVYNPVGLSLMRVCSMASNFMQCCLPMPRMGQRLHCARG